MERPIFPTTQKEAKKSGKIYSSADNKASVFPTQLRKLRAKKGISQEGLSKILGVSKSTLGLWENGDTLPDAKSLRDLAMYFQVSTDYLVGLSKIPSTDKDLEAICNFTGLSEAAINYLNSKKDSHPYIDVYNFLFENTSLLTYIVNYLSGFALNELNKKPFKYIPLKNGSTYPYRKDVHFAIVIRTLQECYSKFEETYRRDSDFINSTIYSFLMRHANIDECKAILSGVYSGFGDFASISEDDIEELSMLISQNQDEGLDNFDDNCIDEFEAEEDEKLNAIKSFLQIFEKAEMFPDATTLRTKGERQNGDNYI